MKKLLPFVLCVVALTGLTIPALALDIEVKANYELYGAITEIAYDGKMFAALRGDKLVTSDDFQSWSYVDAVFKESFCALVYFGGEFTCFGKGVTVKSRDGIGWTRYENNLKANIDKNNYAVNSKALCAFIYADELVEGEYVEKEAGTYQSVDGVNWKRVENVPDGIAIKVVNDKFVMESREYMRGIYISDDGARFTKLQINGNDLDGLIYADGTYFLMDNLGGVDIGYNYLLRSSDLKNWQKEQFPYDRRFPYNTTPVVIDGATHFYDLNGRDIVYRDGMWQSGDKPIPAAITNKNVAFFKYRVTPFGLLAWTNYGNAFFWWNYEDWVVSEVRSIGYVKAIGGQFYAFPAYPIESETCLTSVDGQSWTLVDAIPEVAATRDPQSYSNGEVTLTCDYIRHRYHGGGFTEITAELAYNDGSVSKVAYEGGYSDTLRISSCDGLFFMSGFENGKVYYSFDGINRYEYNVLASPGFSAAYNYPGVVAGNTMLYTGVNNIVYLADIGQFRSAALSPTIKVKLNDEYLSFSTAPVIENERTLIPIRFLFERAGASVDWSDGVITITHEGKTVELKIGSATAKVDGVVKTLDVPARLINEKTFIPLRFISEELGFKVEFDGITNTAVITS